MPLYKHFPEPDFLMHYGILGMRWGHRKSTDINNGTSAREEKELEKFKKKLRSRIELENYRIFSIAPHRFEDAKKPDKKILEKIDKMSLDAFKKFKNNKNAKKLYNLQLKEADALAKDFKHVIDKTNNPIQQQYLGDMYLTTMHQMLNTPYSELKKAHRERIINERVLPVVLSVGGLSLSTALALSGL